MKKWWRQIYGRLESCGLPLALGCLLLPLSTLAGGPVSAEYRLKAALIYKLTKFVEWPADAVANQAGQFGICVLGRDDFGSALDALQGRSVGLQKIVIHRFSQSDAVAEECQIVFVSSSKNAFLASIFQTFGKRPTLTIGDSSQFAERGGMIQLTRDNRHIGFKINLQRAHAAKLQIAAPLLQLAVIVNDRQRVGSR